MNRMVSSAGGCVPGWRPQMPGRGTRPDDAGAVSVTQAPSDRDRPAAAPSDETWVVLEGRTLVAAVAALAGMCLLAFLLGLLVGGEIRAQDGAPPLDAPPTPAGASRVRLTRPGDVGVRGASRADLAASHHKLAGLAQQRGDESLLLAELRQCFAVLEGMKVRGLHFDPAMQQVHEQLAGMLGR